MCGPDLINFAQQPESQGSAPPAPLPEQAFVSQPEMVGKKPNLNRRRLLGMSALLGATLTGVGALGGARPVAAAERLASMGTNSLRVLDLSHAIHTGFPVYKPFAAEPNIYQSSFSAQDGFNALTLEIDEHTGTHMDAPWHFIESPDAYRTEQIPPDQLVCPLVVIRIADRAAQDLDAQVSIDDLLQWERRYGRIPHNALVAMDSGWASRVPLGQQAMGNWDDNGIPHFPGFGHPACEWLLANRSVAGIAVDTLSLDCGPNSINNPNAHRYFLGANKYGLEIVANLGAVPDKGALAIVGVIKTRGGTGGPVRLLATV
jgi:kynurenine formamidase